MKLNEDAPEQQLAILAVGGFLLVFNIILYFKDSGKEQKAHDPNSPVAVNQPVTQVVDETTGTVMQLQTQHQNPSLSWTQMFFCRGLKRASWCSYRELHPDTLEADEVGVAVSNSAPEKNHVVAYRGPMVRNSIFSSRVSIPQEDISERYKDIAPE